MMEDVNSFSLEITFFVKSIMNSNVKTNIDEKYWFTNSATFPSPLQRRCRWARRVYKVYIFCVQCIDHSKTFFNLCLLQQQTMFVDVINTLKKSYCGPLQWTQNILLPWGLEKIHS
jgi:hypothetical protein